MRAFCLCVLLVPGVVHAQLDPPDLLYPGDGGWRWVDDVQEWVEVPGAVEYRVQIGLPDTDFTELAASAFVRGETFWKVSLPMGFYEWRVAVSDGVAWSGWSDVWTFESRFPTGVEPAERVGEAVGLGPLYPNPSAGLVTIRVDGTGGEVDLRVYDLLGREVAVLHRGRLTGSGGVEWNTTGVAPGVYVLRLHSGAAGMETRRVVVR